MSFEAEVIKRLDALSNTVSEVRDDVLIIKGAQYGKRIDDLEDLTASQGERIAKTEVRSGLIGAFIAGVISFFFSGQHGA